MDELSLLLLPDTVTPEAWAKFHEQDSFPKYSHLSTAVYFAVFYTVARLVLTPMVFMPIANKVLHVRKSDSNFVERDCAELRSAFGKKHRLSSTAIKELSSRTGISESELVAWGKELRRITQQGALVKKYTEASWRFLAYLFLSSLSWYIIPSKGFYTSEPELWTNWPNVPVSDDIVLLYMLELGFYFHLFVTQFFDVKRKDFWEMFIHHVVTIFLLIFSYTLNFMNIGSIVLICHDTSDVFLELAKLFNYQKWQIATDSSFVVFTATFAYFRLYMFPTMVVKAAFTTLYVICGPSLARPIFQCLLVTLQLLHCFWFYLISRMAFKLLVLGKIEKDERSATESGSEVEEDDKKEK